MNEEGVDPTMSIVAPTYWVERRIRWVGRGPDPPSLRRTPYCGLGSKEPFAQQKPGMQSPACVPGQSSFWSQHVSSCHLGKISHT